MTMSSIGRGIGIAGENETSFSNPLYQSFNEIFALLDFLEEVSSRTNSGLRMQEKRVAILLLIYHVNLSYLFLSKCHGLK